MAATIRSAATYSRTADSHLKSRGRLVTAGRSQVRRPSSVSASAGLGLNMFSFTTTERLLRIEYPRLGRDSHLSSRVDFPRYCRRLSCPRASCCELVSQPSEGIQP